MMNAGLSDTSPEAERVLIELMRQTPVWRRLEIVGEMNETVRLLILSGLRQRHPDATPEELRRRVPPARVRAGGTRLRAAVL